MESFFVLTEEDALDINAGGLLSAVAGGLAGGLIGTFAGLIPAAVTGNPSYIVKLAVTCGTAGVWVGAGCPMI